MPGKSSSFFSSVHILGSRQLGGADRFYVRLVSALHQDNYRVLAVNRPGSPVSPLLDKAGVAQVQVPLANQWDLWSVLKIKRLIEQWQPAVVQTYMGRATRLTRLPKNCGAIHIARLGGYYKIDGYYRHAHAWVGNTQGICDYLVRSGLPPSRVFKIGNFVPPPLTFSHRRIAELKRQWNIPEDALVIAALGRMYPVKGFDDLLHAFSRLTAAIHQRPLWLAIAGDGPQLGDLRQLARELGIASRIIWTGWLNPPDPLYAVADLFVCPSRHEPLGNVILEAWNYRLPVVSTSTLGATELIEPDVNGLLVEPRQPAALAQRIHSLLVSPENERQKIGEAGRQTLVRDHSREAVVQAYLALYRQLT